MTAHDYYMTLFEQSTDAYLIIEKEAIIDMNNATLEMLGYESKDELLNKHPASLSPEFQSDGQPSINKGHHMIKLAAENSSHQFEWEHMRKDGEIFDVDVLLTQLEINGRQLIHCVWRDLTERKKAARIRKRIEEKAQRHLALFQSVFEHAAEGIALFRFEDFRLSNANQAFAQFLDIKSEHVSSLKLDDVCPDNMTSEELLSILEDSGSDSLIFTKLFNTFKKNKHARISISIVRSSEGKAEYLMSMISDITELKESEQKLKEALEDVTNLKDQLKSDNSILMDELHSKQDDMKMVGKSDAFVEVLNQISQVASTNTTVLIMGETGTGKEQVAQSLHRLSKRQDRPLVKVNCAAIPSTLIESELFGHEKGAFTGATSRKIGRFESANQGTIFLDEIGEIPLEIQPKLLRVLQEGEFERIGGVDTIKIDVRILAATNRDLKQMSVDNLFREDLYHRLYVFPITQPPLRERAEDIPMLANFLLKKISLKTGKKIERISDETMQKLQNYEWPGNIRELENILERAIVLSKGSTLCIGGWFDQNTETSPVTNKRTAIIKSLDEAIHEHIVLAIRKAKGRIRGKHGAATLLGVNPNTLDSKMKKLGINKWDALD